MLRGRDMGKGACIWERELIFVEKKLIFVERELVCGDSELLFGEEASILREIACIGVRRGGSTKYLKRGG